MPTSKWMFERSRGAVALLAAVALVGIVACLVLAYDARNRLPTADDLPGMN